MDAPQLQSGALHWIQVVALGVAIAISGNTAGWNYGLAVGGWGGMVAAALAMLALFFCLTQVLSELAAAMPGAGGFDAYVARAFGVTAGYITGMSVAVALSVGAGLAASFSDAYISAWLGVGGPVLRLSLVAAVVLLQLRGVREAVGLTVVVGVASIAILVLFCAFMAPAFRSANLYSHAGSVTSLLPHGWEGSLRCIPFALFLFLGVEQAAHAASEMRDMQKSIPKAMGTAILVAFIVGMSVLVIATGSAGSDQLAGVDDPLLKAITSDPGRAGAGAMERIVAVGALVAIMGTFFSLAYAGSRQFFHLASAGLLPGVFRRVNSRQAPAPAIGLVGLIATVSAQFPPNSTMVVFIFLISVSHFLLLAAFLRLRQRESGLARPYRALGGQLAGAVAALLSIAVMISCYELESRALQAAVGLLAVVAVASLAVHNGKRRPAQS